MVAFANTWWQYFVKISKLFIFVVEEHNPLSWESTKVILFKLLNVDALMINS